MFILIKTDTGTQRIISTDNIAFVDGTSADRCSLYLKSAPDFEIRVGMNIKDFVKVLNGETSFQDLYKFEGVYSEHKTDSLTKAGVLPEKPVETSKEEIEEVKKEFVEGTNLVKASTITTVIKEEEKPLYDLSNIPSFSKKKIKDQALKAEVPKEPAKKSNSVSRW